MQRLGLAQAILNDPKILLLDEPISGLDPVGRRRVLNLLRDLGEERIIILATHLLADTEQIADYMVVLRDGCVIAHDTPSTLISKVYNKKQELTMEDAYNDLLAKTIPNLTNLQA